jgi:hypothetical protein
LTKEARAREIIANYIRANIDSVTDATFDWGNDDLDGDDFTEFKEAILDECDKLCEEE